MLRFPGAMRHPVRIGVATGPAVVGEPNEERGTQEPIIVGEVLNLAARVQAFAPNDGMAISEATRRLTGAAFEYEDLGEQTFKGFRTPVRVFRIVCQTK